MRKEKYRSATVTLSRGLTGLGARLEEPRAIDKILILRYYKYAVLSQVKRVKRRLALELRCRHHDARNPLYPEPRPCGHLRRERLDLPGHGYNGRYSVS